jgi:hypothetical protein
MNKRALRWFQLPCCIGVYSIHIEDLYLPITRTSTGAVAKLSLFISTQGSSRVRGGRSSFFLIIYFRIDKIFAYDELLSEHIYIQ